RPGRGLQANNPRSPRPAGSAAAIAGYVYIPAGAGSGGPPWAVRRFAAPIGAYRLHRALVRLAESDQRRIDASVDVIGDAREQRAANGIASSTSGTQER